MIDFFGDLWGTQRTGTGEIVSIEYAVTLLGPIRAMRHGTPLYLGTAQQKEVLAVLALRAGMVTTVTQIIDAVWAIRRPNFADNMVHTYISRLRRVLEPPEARNQLARVLRSTPPGYMLAIPPDAVDVNLFERDVRRARLARADGDLATSLRLFRLALNRWYGPALQEATGPLAEAERIRLDEWRQDVIEEATGVRLLLGEDENLVPELRRMLFQQPMRERLWELLLVALGQSSRRAEALAAFQEARSTMISRLGVEPGPQLQDLHLRLLRGEPVVVRRWWERKISA